MLRRNIIMDQKEKDIFAEIYKSKDGLETNIQ
jgi:hypothetical protein